MYAVLYHLHFVTKKGSVKACGLEESWKCGSSLVQDDSLEILLVFVIATLI